MPQTLAQALPPEVVEGGIMVALGMAHLNIAIMVMAVIAGLGNI
jgi:hypothetical protein